MRSALRSGVGLVVVLVAGILLLGAAATPVMGQGLSPEEQSLFHQQIEKLVKLQPTRVSDPAIARVFAATFYNVEVIIGDSSDSLLVARSGSELINVSKPSTTADIPALAKLVKPHFKLKTESDAQAFQSALDALVPITDSDDKAVKTIKHTGNDWTFIRGKFFEHFKGFIVTTSPDGTVKDIKYSLDVK